MKRVRARHRLVEAVPLRGPPGGQPAGRGHRDETVESGGPERGQQRPVENAPAPTQPIPGDELTGGAFLSRTVPSEAGPPSPARLRVGQPDRQVRLGAPLDQLVGRVASAMSKVCVTRSATCRRPLASRSSTASKFRPSVHRTWPAG